MERGGRKNRPCQQQTRDCRSGGGGGEHSACSDSERRGHSLEIRHSNRYIWATSGAGTMPCNVNFIFLFGGVCRRRVFGPAQHPQLREVQSLQGPQTTGKILPFAFTHCRNCPTCNAMVTTTIRLRFDGRSTAVLLLIKMWQWRISR